MTIDHRAFKDNLFGELARIGKALANPHRLEFFDLLAQREWSVEELAKETTLSVANDSQHLQILHHAKLVSVHLPRIIRRLLRYPNTLVDSPRSPPNQRILQVNMSEHLDHSHR